MILFLSFSDHISLHIRAVGEWTNRLLNFFEKEQQRLHNGEVPEYDEQMAHGSNAKLQVIEAYVTDSKVDKVDERSDGTKMKQNMILSKAHQRIKSAVKVPMEKAFSMPDMETKLKNTEKFKK